MSIGLDKNILNKVNRKIEKLLNSDISKYKDKGFDKDILDVIKYNIESFLNNISALNIEGLTAPIILKHLDTYAQLI